MYSNSISTHFPFCLMHNTACGICTYICIYIYVRIDLLYVYTCIYIMTYRLILVCLNPFAFFFYRKNRKRKQRDLCFFCGKENEPCAVYYICLSVDVSICGKPDAGREVGGWGQDPKKCTGRDWGMGSSTI